MAKQLLEEFCKNSKRTFVDIDLRLKKPGQNHHIFEKYGEDEFRKIEKKHCTDFLKVKIIL